MLGTSRPLAAHSFAACTYVCPQVIWAALTDPDQSAAFFYGLAAHSTWVPGAPIAFRHGNGTGLTGRVLHARRNERLSYLLQSRPDGTNSAEDAEDIWLPVLAALQDLVNPG
jgi:uncharacterized protein YndB with AHSA1/START domain